MLIIALNYACRANAAPSATELAQWQWRTTSTSASASAAAGVGTDGDDGNAESKGRGRKKLSLNIPNLWGIRSGKNKSESTGEDDEADLGRSAETDTTHEESSDSDGGDCGDGGAKGLERGKKSDDSSATAFDEEVESVEIQSQQEEPTQQIDSTKTGEKEKEADNDKDKVQPISDPPPASNQTR